MKKFIVGLLAVAMVCSLAACSDKSSTNPISTAENTVKVENLTGTKDEIKDNKAANDATTEDENITDTWILAAGRTGAYIDSLETVKDEDEGVANIINYATTAKEAGYDAYSFIATKYESDQTSYAYYAINTNLTSQPDAIVVVIVKEDSTTSVAEFTGDKSEIFGSYAPTETDAAEDTEVETAEDTTETTEE